MHGCQGCQEQLLDHLYGLLETAEEQTLVGHLASCPACQTALQLARAQQQILASAARFPFPGVRFLPPETAVVTNEPHQILLPIRPRFKKPARHWVGWAAAAGILLALAGLSVPAYQAHERYEASRTIVEQHDRSIADARKKIDDARKKIDDIHHDINARELRLVVTGPRSVQPGTPAEYQVRTFDLNGKPAEVDLSARLGNATSENGAAQKKDEASLKRERVQAETKAMRQSSAQDNLTVTAVAPGNYRVRIPPTVHFQPGRSLAMLVSANKKAGSGGDPVRLSGQVRLTAPVYLTHLTTDKPMYQPGEFVHFRSLTLGRLTLHPPAEDFFLNVTLTSPTGAVQTILQGRTSLVLRDGKDQLRDLLGPDGKPVHGIGGGSWLIDPSLPGGEYTLTVQEQYGRFAPVSRKFLVNRYQKPRLDKKVDFNRATYGPGDEVQVRAHAILAGGGPVRDCPIEATITVDDKNFDARGIESTSKIQTQTDKDGAVLVRFTLPRQIERGSASLAVTFKGAAHETIVRPIPLILAKINLTFFPEGGDLVAGLTNRVYFQARTPLVKPAQVRGTLLENGKPLPVAVATLHDDAHPGVNQGHGLFTFLPRAGQTYALRIDTPSGIAATKPLPAVKTDGVVLRVEKGVFDADEPIRVHIEGTKPRSLLVGAYCRGEVLDTMPLPTGQGDVVLRPSGSAGGVCRVTVFEEVSTGQTQRTLKPIAERLIFRHPRGRVDVSISPNQRRYLPGQKVKLSLATTNEKEKLTPSVLMVGVVDRSVTNMADVKTDRAMPTHFLLTSEIRRADDLEYADFLLGPQARAPQALDLLLGTQGWRRFVEQDRQPREAEAMPAGDRQRDQEEAERLLVLVGQSPPRRTEPDQEKIASAQAEFTRAREVVEEADDQNDYKSALATLTRFDYALHHGRQLALPILAGLVVVLTLIGLVRALGQRHELRWAGLAMVCAGLLALVWYSPADLGVPGSAGGSREVAALQVPEAPEEEHPDAQIEMTEGGAAQDLAADDKAQPHLKNAEKAKTSPTRPQATGLPAAAGFGGGVEKFDKRAPGAMVPGAPVLAPTPAPAPGKMGGARDRKGAMPARGTAGLHDEARAWQDRELQRDGLARNAERDAFPFALPNVNRQEQLKQLEAQTRIFARRQNNLPLGSKIADAKGRGFLASDLPLIVREYAHVHKESAPGVRDDFTETVYWHPVLVLPNGKSEVSFDLPDSVTTFEVTAFAHTLDGRLGSAVKRIESRLPFSLAPKLPTEVTAGDRIDVPVTVSNTTTDPHAVDLAITEHEGLDLLSDKRSQSLSLAPEARGRRIFSLRPNIVTGSARVAFQCKAGPFTDGIREGFRVVPDGFPTQGATSDLLEGSASHRVTLPKWIPGTLACQVEVYPSTLADLQKGLDGLLREPHGCFEQSSTTNYPNVLILDYLRTSENSNPELEKRVRDLLSRGYARLTSFECEAENRRRGYEWFGGRAAPHEALTAYGLLQFRDMARFHPVDAAMLQRTRDYLLSQKDNAGGFKRNPQAIDSFGRAPQAITNAYIVWALTESGTKDDVTKELDALSKQAQASDDPYFLSLVAISLANRNRGAEAEKILRKVAGGQKDDGRLEAKETSITGSGGRDLQIETTALALLGWLKANPIAFVEPINKAARWVGQQRGGFGGFGSTQSTILALKALIAHASANKRSAEAGELRLFIGDEKVAEMSFPAGIDKPLRLAVPDPEKKLVAGVNKLRVEITGAKNHFPHTLSWTARTTKPASTSQHALRIATRLAHKDLSEGDSVRLNVRVENKSGKGQGMAVAIIGLPAGLIVPEDLRQLKEHCRLPSDGSRPLLGTYEIQGRELILYWRDLAKDQVIEVPLDLIARVPGSYRGPASRAYLYYNADHKHWVEPLAVTIAAGK